MNDLTQACASLRTTLDKWYEGAEDENGDIDSRFDDAYDLAESASSLLFVLTAGGPK